MNSACHCRSRWCRRCTPEGPESKPLQTRPAAVVSKIETTERAPTRLARAEARQLQRTDPRAEWAKRARAYLDEHPGSSFGDVADHLGISVLDTVAALHGLKGIH